MSHQYLVTAPLPAGALPGAAAAVAARPRPARLLPAGDRRARHGRLRAGRPHVAVAVDTCRPPTSTAGSWRPTGTGSARSSPTPRSGCRCWPTSASASMINGPEGFTPDNEFCLGETEVAGFFVAAGFCAHGIAGAGGIGDVMANWVLDGDPGIDLWHMDVRRFGRHYRSPRYTLARTRENYETYYDIRYPGAERRRVGRCGRRPRTRWHAAHGARVRGEGGLGAREPLRGTGATRRCGRGGGRGGTGRRASSPSTGRCARRRACSTRRRSPRSRSPGRTRRRSALHVFAGHVARPPGAVVYTQALNERGGIEMDVTVVPARRRRASSSSPARRSGRTTSAGCAGRPG